MSVLSRKTHQSLSFTIFQDEASVLVLANPRQGENQVQKNISLISLTHYIKCQVVQFFILMQLNEWMNQITLVCLQFQIFIIFALTRNYIKQIYAESHTLPAISSFKQTSTYSNPCFYFSIYSNYQKKKRIKISTIFQII